MGDRPQIELFGALQSLYQSREYADITILTRDSSRQPVHRAIICPRSRFFANAVKEGRWREGREGEIAMPDDDPEVVRLMIEYFYLLDYLPFNLPSNQKDLPDSPTSHGDSDTLSVRTDALNFGHVYGTSAVSAFGGPQMHRSQTDLQPYSNMYRHSRDRSESSLTVHAMPGHDISSFGGPSRRPRQSTSRGPKAPEVSPLATQEPHLNLHARVYAVADKYGVAGLKALALDKLKIQLTRHWDSHELAEAIHVVYNSTPSSDKDMREAIADTLNWHGSLLEKPEVEVAVMEINGLAYELLKRARRAEPEYD